MDCQPFNTDTIGYNWLFSSLRDWLNEEFYEKAFSQVDQLRIYAGTSDKKEYRYIKDGLSTDPLFILSSTGLNPIYGIEYNSISDVSRPYKELQAEGTLYVKARYNGNKNQWWLAAGGKERALLIEEDGSLGSSSPSDADIGVRPALWYKE